MSDDELLLALKDNLGSRFGFGNAKNLIEKCDVVLKEVKQSVTDGYDLQLRNFHVQQDAIMKYREEKNFQLCKQEKAFLEKTARLNEQAENVQRNVKDILTELTGLAVTKNAKQQILQSLELEQVMNLKEHDANIQSLEGVKKSVLTGLTWYNRFLGIEITNDAADGQRFYIQFKVDDQVKKIPVTKNNDGFIFPDGSVAATPSAFISNVCRERKKCCQPSVQLEL